MMIQQFPQAFLHQPVSSQPKGSVDDDCRLSMYFLVTSTRIISEINIFSLVDLYQDDKACLQLNYACRAFQGLF